MAELHSVPNVITLDCDSVARAAMAPRGANMVLLGAAAGVLGILGPDDLRKGIANVFARKGEAVVASNIAAFDAGLEESKNVMK